jgi:hypothetical protein
MVASRRDIFRGLPAILCSTGLLADEQETLPCKIYEFDAMPVRNTGSLI